MSKKTGKRVKPTDLRQLFHVAHEQRLNGRDAPLLEHIKHRSVYLWQGECQRSQIDHCICKLLKPQQIYQLRAFEDVRRQLLENLRSRVLRDHHLAEHRLLCLDESSGLECE